MFTITSPRVKPVLVILVLVHVHYISLSHRDCAAGIGGKDGDTIYFKDSIDTAKASFLAVKSTFVAIKIRFVHCACK